MRDWVFSHSHLQTADCSNKEYFQYHLKLQSNRFKQVKARKIGKIFASCLEILYKSTKQDLSMDALSEDAILDTALSHGRGLAAQIKDELVMEDDDDNAIFKREVDIALGLPLIMVEAYYRYMFINESYVVVASEEEFKVAVRTPQGRKSPNMKYLSYCDQIVRDMVGDQDLWLHELKTGAQWSEKNEQYLKIDPQTTGYLWSAREDGRFPLVGVLYTMCLKTQSRVRLTAGAKKRMADNKKAITKARKDGEIPPEQYVYHPINDYETAQQYLDRVRGEYLENPEKYFIRRKFKRTQAQLDRFSIELYNKCWNAKDKMGRRPVSEPSLQRCGMCDAMDICSTGIPFDVHDDDVKRTPEELLTRRQDIQILDASIARFYARRDRIDRKDEAREDMEIGIDFDF